MSSEKKNNVLSAYDDEVKFASVADAVEDIRQGKMVIVMDDEGRENEGDLIMAAEFATQKAIAFIVKHTTGILCAPMPASRAKALDLKPMVDRGNDPNQTAFTITCDSIDTTTGVAASERSTTFNQLADFKQFGANHFSKPGHIFPLVAKAGGVLQRQGHTEASVDLCKLAGLSPVGVIGEIVKGDDGEMMRVNHCYQLAQEHGLKLITIEAMMAYIKELTLRPQDDPARQTFFSYPVEVDAKFIWSKVTKDNNELQEDFNSDATSDLSQSGDDDVNPLTDDQLIQGVELRAQCELPVSMRGLKMGPFTMKIYYSQFDKRRHSVLVLGDIIREPYDPVLTRVHSECFTGDVFGSQRCDCGEQLFLSMKKIHERGRGVLIYNVGHEGRGIGLENKIKAYHLQQTKGMNTYEANHALGFEDDLRNYNTAKGILLHLGVQKVELMTNNMDKSKAFGNMVVKQVAVDGTANEHNSSYLSAKREKSARQLNQATSFKSMPEFPHLVQKQQEQQPASSTCDHLTQDHALTHLDVVQKIDLTKLSQLKVGIAKTKWNNKLLDPLVEAVYVELQHAGVLKENIDILTVPGSFELPMAAQTLTQQCDVVLAIGLLIKGETLHFEMISEACATGLMQVQLNNKRHVPVINGVLNCITEGQAEVRCNTKECDLYKSWTGTAIHMGLMRYKHDESA